MKKNFLEQLEQHLEAFEITREERNEIVSDYEAMIDDAVEAGKTEEEIILLIGSPNRIIQDLELEYKRKKRIPHGDKIIALTPFISLITFMLLGIIGELWHPGWLVFLLIPMTAIVIEMLNDKDNHLLTALSPFVATITFIVLGSLYDMWHPAWLVFLLIPILAIINSRKDMRTLETLTALSPFISVVLFIVLYSIYETANPTWLVFLLVILFGVLQEKSLAVRITLWFTLVVSIVLYLYIGIVHEHYGYALLSFLIFLIPAVFTNNIMIKIDGLDTWQRRMFLLAVTVVFIVLGVITSMWGLVWIIFLLIPMFFIIQDKKEFQKITALTPFIALILFMLLGYLLGAWAWAWLVFLLIPMVAIVENA